MNRRRATPVSFAFIARLRRLPLLRGFSLLLALCCFWSFAGAGAVMAAAPDRSKGAGKPQHSRFPHAPVFQAVTSPFLRSTPVQPHSAPSAASFQAAETSRLLLPLTPSPTLLDEVGHLAHPVAATDAAAWSRELAACPLPARAALLHLWLGEWQLASSII